MSLAVDELNKIDVLFVGAGPASLAGAIKLKQLLNQKGRSESVVVVEKAGKIGQHNLSGAIFEAGILDELIPGWRENPDGFVRKMLDNQVIKDELFFLGGDKAAIRLPEFIVPPAMRNQGNYTLSVSKLVNWLAGIARGLGVELYTGFAASEVMVEGNMVTGVKLGDKGLDKESKQQPNYMPGDRLEAKVTVFGEGSLGRLAEEVVNRFNLGNGRNPQVYSLGVKEIIKLPEGSAFGSGRVILAVALALALDWKYCDLSPQQELQFFKSHSFIKRLIDGGEVISYGARTLPEGGYYALSKLAANGAIIIGDAAGLVNTRKIKGLHYAIKSGMVAAEAIFGAIEKQDFSRRSLRVYEDLLEDCFVMKDLRTARNYRQVFAKAGTATLYLGAPLSIIQQWLPFRLGTKPDYESMKKARLNRLYDGGIDRLTAVSLSGTIHREDEPSHITFSDPGQCQRCSADCQCHPCAFFCPAEVYKFEEDELILNPVNCLHCQTCRIKCPHQIIQWQVPEGGDGPRYKAM
jgi:electron-transferring-flavoprotein dehydrogenase